MRVLVTGAAGFIGFHLCLRLAAEGHTVIGLDNLNDYYSPQLKKDRLSLLQANPEFQFIQADIADGKALRRVFDAGQCTHVVHLAAQAGVRYSIDHPDSYVQSNFVGFANILECCRHTSIAHLVFASSSSVYGLNTTVPFTTGDPVDHPISLYAASKKGNEMMAHCYSYLYNLPATGLRFFTVYGPWGRPDMALFIFTKAILEGSPIPVFNHGQMQRDFTYIDDIVTGVVKVLAQPATPSAAWNPSCPDPAISCAPYRLYNIGNNQPVPLLEFIATLEQVLGKKAQVSLLPMQPGDVPATYADISALEQCTGFRPSTPLQTGIQKFVDWYKSYYAI